MKKILAFIFTISIICTAASASNFFKERIFEIKTGADFGISNNLFSCKDLLKKDLVIDLRKIADECPKNGFDIRASVDPKLEVNLNIIGLNFGYSSGIESYEKFNLGKDIFDFLGYGNTVGETLEINFNNSTEVYAYSEVKVGFNIGKFKINVRPAVFLPVLSICNSGGSLTVRNDSDGKLAINMTTDMAIYSSVPLKSDDDGVTFDTDSMADILAGNYGLDLGGSVGYAFSDTFSIEGVCRVPVIPGHLKNKASVKGGFTYNMKLTDFENSEKETKETEVVNEEAFYAINRPMKLSAYVNKDLLGKLFIARAGAGLGIQRPFCDGAYCYPEYYLGLTFNFINIVKVGISTEYTSQLFKHQIGTSVNVRVVQLDLGISTQSSNFKKSMEVSGVGAYAFLTVGF